MNDTPRRKGDKDAKKNMNTYQTLRLSLLCVLAEITLVALEARYEFSLRLACRGHREFDATRRWWF
jgi:hypothetical protein